ncbi:MAG: sialidase [Verrucomicrobia bacterium]|nr:sialidase [Verrucomicrobiota bacterium]
MGLPGAGAAEGEAAWARLAPFFAPPPEYANQLGSYPSPLKFYDGRPVKEVGDWPKRRQEILARWHGLMGAWPRLLAAPRIDFLGKAQRENFTQHRVRVEIAEDYFIAGYLLVPDGTGPFPAAFVPYYDPETSIGVAGQLRDFAYQLARRGFVTLSIGSPGGDARKPDLGKATCQPLSFLAYVAANCHTVLANQPGVDAARIGVVGHSYGGKWALFASCLYEKYACGVWSDPGIIFDDTRGSINYWEPWYLGYEAGKTRKPGLITPENPAHGPYKVMRETGRDLTELHALMAPRPFLVSGGSEDYRARWVAVNHAIAVNSFLGYQHRAAMTNRPAHSPTVDSNEAIYLFFEHFLKPGRPAR